MAGYNGQIVATHNGRAPVMENGLLEANSMSFVAGELVYVSSGALEDVASTETAVLGFAMEPATNVTSGNAYISVQVIHPGDRIVLSTTNAGTDVDASTFTRYTKYGIYTASNVNYANLGDTTNDALIFLGHVPTNDGSTSYRGIFTVLDSVLQITAGV